MSTYSKKYFELKNKSSRYSDTVIFSLFSHVSNLTKEEITIHFSDEINNEKLLDELITKIDKGLPYQYALGYTYFLSSKYYVDNNVLIPRQETEQLVLDTERFIKDRYQNKEVKILDMCSGSGVIGIELSKRITNSKVTLVDISESANKVAGNNAILNKTKVDIINSDLFSSLNEEKYDVIVSNPPYIKSKETVDESTLKYEPHLALFAEDNGLYFYKKILQNSKKHLNNGGFLAFEIGEDQVNELTELIDIYSDIVSYEFKKDIYDRFRFLYIFR